MRWNQHVWLWLLVATLCGAAAGECVSEAGAPRPDATKASDLDWMTGYWRGQLKDGSRLEQHFPPVRAGVMTGIFRLDTPKGEPLYEVVVLRDTERGPELRVRHFLKDFMPLEPGDKPIVLHLVTAAPGCAEFVNETTGNPRRSLLERHGDTLRTRSELVRADGSPGTIVAEWEREGAEPPSAATGPGLPQAAWLTGHWSGSFDGGTIELWWLEPKAGAMAGLMRFDRGDRVSMIEFYGAAREAGKLRTYTWQLGPELLLTEKNPRMTAEAVHSSPGRLVFRLVGGKLQATTTVTHRGARMRERVEVKQNGKAITMVIDFVKHEASPATAAGRRSGE